MKKLFTIVIGVLLTASVFAQAPEKISYQAVVRNSNDKLVTNSKIGMQISILKGSADGTVIYSETQTPSTNANGLINIEIGSGAGFSAIDWSAGVYFIETKIDPTGSTNYTITGTSQLLSVPYALHAKTAETVNGGVTETDPVFTAWNKDYNSLTNRPTLFSGSYTDLTNKPTTDGSETKVTAGTNVSITGAGTTASPYVINSIPIITQAERDALTATEGLVVYNTTTGKPNYYNGIVWMNFDGTLAIDLPTLTTAAVTEITQTTARSGGDITSNGGAKIIASGVCWSTSHSPTLSDSKTEDGSETGNFASSLTNLNPNTTYYVRAYATNIKGTTYGNEVSFKTIAADGTTGTLTYNGYTYKTVYINGKEWLAENLRTTTYNDGQAIPNVTDNATWEGLSTGAYCWYNNNIIYQSVWGALYNWHAINTGKLAPAGWHVATYAEWNALKTYLGGTDVAGGKLKEVGTTYWTSPNTGATNATGFTAVAGGARRYDGTFQHLGFQGFWWNATEYNATNAKNMVMSYISSGLFSFDDSKASGYSVRLVRD